MAVQTTRGGVCENYARLDSRVRVKHIDNCGAGLARNIGLDLANGQWITFVDSDDYIENNAIEEMLRMADEEKADMVIGGYYGYGLVGYVRWNCIPDGVNTCTGKELITKQPHGIPWCMLWGKLYAKELWENMRFSKEYYYNEDAWMMPQIFCKANRTTTYPRAIYRYYERNNSLTHSSQSDYTHLEGKLKNYLYLFNFYREQSLEKSAALEALNFLTIFQSLNSVCEFKKLQNTYLNSYRHCIQYLLFSRNASIKTKIKIFIRHVLRSKKQG